jgi:hypothetical protein
MFVPAIFGDKSFLLHNGGPASIVLDALIVVVPRLKLQGSDCRP